MKRVRASLVGIALSCVAIAAQAQRKVDNIGNAGGLVIGAERLAGVYHTKNTAETTQEEAGVELTTEVETSTTTFAVFGHNPGAFTEIPRLALDYFVIDGFSVGGSLMFMRNNIDIGGEQRISGAGSPTQSSDLEDQKITQQVLVVHPRIGYAVAFNEYVGVWPRAGISYTHLERTQKVSLGDPVQGSRNVEVKSTLTFTNLTLEGLLFVSPFSNFAFVGGPFADLGLGGR